jgi:diguanylate cyclase (GGDEF)-like protein
VREDPKRGGRRLALGIAAAVALAFAGVLAQAGLRNSWPNFAVVGVFTLLLVATENSVAVLPTNITVSPAFMVVMSSVAAMGHRQVILGAMLVGIGGGLSIGVARRRRWYVVAFNSAQTSLSSAAAAGAYLGVQAAGLPGPVAAVGATAAYAAVNAALVVPVVARHSDVAPGAVWANMAPTLPNYLVFGAVGFGMGVLYSHVGVISVLGLVTLLIVARSVFFAVTRMRQAYQRLTVLHRFSQEMGRSADLETVVGQLLTRLCQLLGAGRAQLLIQGEGATRRYLLDGDRLETPGAELPDENALLDVMSEGECTSGGESISAPIHLEAGVRGAVMVSRRLGRETTFGEDDRTLFEALTNQASVSLANGRMVDRLRHDSTHDLLTGLPNRTFFGRVVDELVNGRASSRAGAVVLLDLDRFKDVNETLGHSLGDQLLRQVGRRLSGALGSEATVARLGGDEFGIVLPSVRDAQEANAAAQSLLAALRSPISVREFSFEVEASAGIVLAPEHGADAVSLLQRADVAMYRAKRQRTSCELYDATTDESSPRRLALAAELRGAIAMGAVVPHFQPEVDLDTGVVVGVEALARWIHPTHGIVPPDDFISIAEQSGTIKLLTAEMISQSLRQCAAWRKDGIDLGLAINVSPWALNADLVKTVERELEKSGIAASQLTLELTESSIMADPARTIGILDDLARLGVTISVDDFGTGYSSLSYLKRLPVREIKIDRSFVMGMSADTVDAAIVRSTVELSHTLGLRVVAEGVEDQMSLSHLRDWGCDLAQGYYFSRPLAGAVLLDWMAGYRQSQSTA